MQVWNEMKEKEKKILKRAPSVYARKKWKKNKKKKRNENAIKKLLLVAERKLEKLKRVIITVKVRELNTTKKRWTLRKLKKIYKKCLHKNNIKKEKRKKKKIKFSLKIG